MKLMARSSTASAAFPNPQMIAAMTVNLPVPRASISSSTLLRLPRWELVVRRECSSAEASVVEASPHPGDRGVLPSASLSAATLLGDSMAAAAWR